jgi:hypothetical protein
MNLSSKTREELRVMIESLHSILNRLDVLRKNGNVTEEETKKVIWNLEETVNELEEIHNKKIA